MSLFKIPKAICDGINSVLAKYWWDQSRNEKKIHWINWNKLCSPKNKGGIGFWDIHAFNLAMLAKQAWSLIQGSHSLFYKVYKARYFPFCSFMEAELGSNPSFVWRSLLQARELITACFAWKIGDGEIVGIESHKWLPRPPSFKPEADRSLKVCQLFDADTRQWNRPLIQSLFHASTRDDILRIKLGDARTWDKLHWIETKSPTFSVKSAYHVALRLSNAAVGEHSLANQDKGLWNKVWSLNTPPKVRNFLWCACFDIFPTRVNLQRRKVQVNPKCGICGQQDETTSHVLWECPFAQCTWSHVPGKIQKSNSIASCFHLLTRQMIGRLPKKELEVWAIISWSLWNARNKFHFEQVQIHPAGIHRGAMAFLEEYQRHMVALQPV